MLINEVIKFPDSSVNEVFKLTDTEVDIRNTNKFKSLTQIKRLRKSHVEGVTLIDIPITDLYGFPEYVKISVRLSELSKLETVKGDPITMDPVAGRFVIRDCPKLTSLSHCYKTITQCNMLQFKWQTVKTALLSVLRIKDLHILASMHNDQAIKFEQAVRIINSFLPIKSMSDIMKCKQELINANLSQYAKM